jgi:hypothetical protein
MRWRWACHWRWALLIGLLGVAGAACTSPGTSGTVPSAPDLALRAGATLAVIGVKGERQPGSGDSPGVQDRRVGFGLTSLLAESLFDTGKFRLVEEKEVRKRELIEELVATYWIGQRGPYTAHELGGLAQHLGVDLLAYGSVAYAGASGQRLALGPLSRAEHTLRVQVHACVYEASTRATLCRAGQGEARQEGTGLVYAFRHDRLDFEKNAVGRATKEAVVQAVHHLLTSLRFAS